MLEHAPREHLVVLETRAVAVALVQLRTVATVAQRLAPRLVLIRVEAEAPEHAGRITGVVGVFDATPNDLPPDPTPSERTFIAAREVRHQPKSRLGEGRSRDTPGFAPPAAGYTGADKRVKRTKLRWQIAAKRGRIRAMADGPAERALERFEKAKASVRAKVEHPFRVIKRQFGLMRVRFRGLAKLTAHVITLLALSNLWRARRQLLVTAG